MPSDPQRMSMFWYGIVAEYYLGMNTLINTCLTLMQQGLSLLCTMRFSVL